MDIVDVCEQCDKCSQDRDQLLFSCIAAVKDISKTIVQFCGMDRHDDWSVELERAKKNLQARCFQYDF